MKLGGNKHVDKDAQKIVKAMLASGNWEIVPARKHLKLKLIKIGRMMCVACTTSDVRSYMNLKSAVRRMEREAGLNVSV